MTAHAKQNRSMIQLQPREFTTYLTDVVGFEAPQELGSAPPLRRRLLLFRRPLAEGTDSAVDLSNPEVCSAEAVQARSYGSSSAAADPVRPRDGEKVQEANAEERREHDDGTHVGIGADISIQ